MNGARGGTTGMMLTDQYCDTITAMLKQLVSSQRDKFDVAQSWIAEVLAQGGLFYVTGSGHSHMIAEEVFFRAGGAAPVQAICLARSNFPLGSDIIEAERSSAMVTGNCWLRAYSRTTNSPVRACSCATSQLPGVPGATR